ncbi:MAG: exodeoxyribonuclease VII small subunit [Phycisphaerae bacterium]|nr:exodeoxyribonuclease VII small subunit [Phycisphaerae bacterium]
MTEPKKNITFEAALETLETIVSQIESGKVSLEESIEKYAEGTRLIETCRGILDQAEKKIQLLAKTEGDTLAPEGELADEAESS